MLIITRRNAESIAIGPADGLNPDMTVAELFASGPLEVTVFSRDGKRIKLGITAPTELEVRRAEAEPDPLPDTVI